MATWIAPPGISRLPTGRLRRLESGFDGGDLGQTVVWRRDITHNVGTLAAVAKAGGLKGLLIDPESYGLTMWSFPDLRDPGAPSGGLPDVYGHRTWDQVRGTVRQRGRELGRAISDAYVDSTIILFHAMSFAALQVHHDPLNRWPSLAEAPFGLMGPFLDGLLEGTSDETTVVDANSWTHQPTLDSDFELGRRLVAVEGLQLSQVPALYAEKVKVGFTIRTSYDPGENLPGELFDPDDPDANYYSPAHLESSMIKAIEHGDGYVLLWEGQANWWLDSATAVPAGGAPYGPWSKHVSPRYWDALADARAIFDDPLPAVPEPAALVPVAAGLLALGRHGREARASPRSCAVVSALKVANRSRESVDLGVDLVHRLHARLEAA